METYVTLEEFITNGGKLQSGRQIYKKAEKRIKNPFIPAGIHFYMGGTPTPYDSYFKPSGEKHISGKDGYVKIELKKIYK